MHSYPGGIPTPNVKTSEPWKANDTIEFASTV